MSPLGPRRPLRVAAVAGLALVGGLALPAPAPTPAPAPPGGAPFVWGRDSVWQSLERAFVAARGAGCGDTADGLPELAALSAAIDDVEAAPLAPRDARLDSLEARLFAAAPRSAACRAFAPVYAEAVGGMRTAVKRQSEGWDPNDRAVRERLYRLLYGGRAAVEEVMAQAGDVVPPLQRGVDEPSVTPSATVQGVRLHSGDLLVSRGGYPTSALIARGSDFPGNFSHVALVHVDSVTRAVSVIEAHIERGVAIATADEYLADKKLRILVLRPRADLPALGRDPMLPHRAATALLDRARREHVAYDFAMDYADASRLFCSEVASSAYAGEGVTLWMGRSTITRPGLRAWLAAFGVTHFETQEPSDLEYDPQLRVVAEWRDPVTLADDRIDNAVTDAMLEGADTGDRLGYDWYALPLARVLKGWSVVKNALGAIGPIPEGMGPAAALRNRAYGARHDALAEAVAVRADEWRRTRGYAPPYWGLVAMAREAVRGGGRRG